MLVAAFGSSPTQVLQLAHGPIRDGVPAGAVAEEARQDVEVASSIRHHRRDVPLELLEQTGPDDLPQQGPAAGDGHGLAAGVPLPPAPAHGAVTHRVTRKNSGASGPCIQPAVSLGSCGSIGPA